LEDLPAERWKEIPLYQKVFMVCPTLEGLKKSLDRYIEQRHSRVVGRWIKGKTLSQTISKTPNHYKKRLQLRT